MARLAAPALHAIVRLCAAAKRVAVAFGRRRPTVLGTMDNRMLRDIGLSRYDLWHCTAEPLFRAPASLGTPLAWGRNEPGRAVHERRSHQVLRRLWAWETGS